MPNEQRTRLKLIVAYDGTPFRGWQSQKGGNTIQDWLELAFAKAAEEAVRVHGAGRTDAGVHAIGQCAHADVRGGRLTAETWRNALNASLPQEIRIMRCTFVSESFHARFSARGKVYRYRIFNGPVLPPCLISRAWHVIAPVKMEQLSAAAKLFLGSHDFAAFTANRGHPVDSTVRTLHSVSVRRQGKSVVLEFEGDGFLYKMVRLLVGTAVRCALGKEDPANIRKQLTNPAPREMRHLVAPACGLTLMRVRY